MPLMLHERDPHCTLDNHPTPIGCCALPPGAQRSYRRPSSPRHPCALHNTHAPQDGTAPARFSLPAATCDACFAKTGTSPSFQTVGSTVTPAVSPSQTTLAPVARADHRPTTPVQGWSWRPMSSRSSCSGCKTRQSATTLTSSRPSTLSRRCVASQPREAFAQRVFLTRTPPFLMPMPVLTAPPWPRQGGRGARHRCGPGPQHPRRLQQQRLRQPRLAQAHGGPGRHLHAGL